VQIEKCKMQIEERSCGDDDAAADGVSAHRQAAEAVEDLLPEIAQVNRHRQVE
jgi:hypothetical protein